MAVCSANLRPRWSVPFMSWNGPSRKRKGKSCMSHRVGLDQAAVVEAAAKLVDVVRAVLAPYRLSEEDAIHAIRGLRSIVHGFISLEVGGGFGMPIDQDASFHWLINLYIAGLEQKTRSL